MKKRNVKYWWQRRTRGWSDDECWNLDYEFIKWINSRLKQYCKDASEYIDLENYKFKYKRKEYTQKELIKKIIEISDDVLERDFFLEDFFYMREQVNSILDIFKLIFWTLWW